MFCPACGQQLPEGTKFCTKCGQETDARVASSSASTPPPPSVPPSLTPPIPPRKAAGKKKIVKILGIVFGCFVGLIVIGSILSRHSTPNTSQAPSGSTKPASSGGGYTLSAKESTLLNALMIDDAESFGKGQNSVIGRDMTLVSAQDVASEYKENEVAADQSFYKKQLIVTGVVASINSGLGNRPYITFKSTNMFQQPQASFSGSLLKAMTSSPTNPGDVDKRIAGLKKGQKITLICKGGGSIMGGATFDDCVFADDYARAAAPKLKESILKVLAGSEKPTPATATMALYTLALARTLPDTSPCFTGQMGGKCQKDIDQLFKNRSTIDGVSRDLVKEFQAKGIDLSKGLPNPAEGTK